METFEDNENSNGGSAGKQDLLSAALDECGLGDFFVGDQVCCPFALTVGNLKTNFNCFNRQSGIWAMIILRIPLWTRTMGNSNPITSKAIPIHHLWLRSRCSIITSRQWCHQSRLPNKNRRASPRQFMLSQHHL